MKVVLRINTLANIKKKVLELQRTTNFGRSSKNEVQIEDEKISARHFRLFLKEDRLELTDLDSKNGTYLNGILVEQSEVFIGDEIKIGDTVISLFDEEFDAEALEYLTFPGPFKDRLNYELKADFTGARIQNQLMNKQYKAIPKMAVTEAHEQEIALRKKAHSRIKLSKEGIKARNKGLSFLALATDYLLMAALLSLPVVSIFFSKASLLDQKVKLLIIIGSEVIIFSLFMYLNFKISKFTFGESLVGIKAKYQKQ